jgi:large subunit ribosomal protein L10
MPTPQKEKIVAEMADKFSKARSIFLADFSGIDANTINALRKKFNDEKVEYRIVKNTLAKISFENAGIDGMDSFLSGINSYAISYDDPTLPMKVVDGFKSNLEDKFVVKAAYFEGQIIGPEQITGIAKLPSREQLMAQLVGILQAPMSKLVGTLQASTSKLLMVLKALEAKKGKEKS